MINWRNPLFVLTTAFSVLATVCVVAIMASDAGAMKPSHGGVVAGVVADSLRFEYKARHMGVVGRIVVYAPNEDAAQAAAAAAFDRIAAVDDALSNYRNNSELGILVRAASSEPHDAPVSVSSDLLRVFVVADSMWRASDGAFDPTVGPLTSLWARSRQTGKLPVPGDIDEARRRVGWENVRIDDTAKTVQLLRAGITIDPGGIAKGYACDEALRVLRASGLTRALIQLGGDIVAGDPPPGATGWLVAGKETGGMDSLQIANAALSTSGDSEQHVVVDGITYSHIVDPRSGIGLTHRTVVTVLAQSGIVADALSTAVSAMGGAAGAAMAAQRYPGARIWYRTR